MLVLKFNSIGLVVNLFSYVTLKCYYNNYFLAMIMPCVDFFDGNTIGSSDILERDWRLSKACGFVIQRSFDYFPRSQELSRYRGAPWGGVSHLLSDLHAMLKRQTYTVSDTLVIPGMVMRRLLTRLLVMTVVTLVSVGVGGSLGPPLVFSLLLLLLLALVSWRML